MRRALAAVILLALDNLARAQGPLDFAAFPSRPVYSGHSAAPDLSKSYARVYRTSIKKAANEPTNFAGHYSLVFVGCGSDECIRGVLLDRYNGHVERVPFGFCGARALYDVVDVADFKPDSHLVVLTGLYDCGYTKGTYCYNFDGRAFRLLAVKPLPKPPDHHDSGIRGANVLISHRPKRRELHPIVPATDHRANSPPWFEPALLYPPRNSFAAIGPSTAR